VRLSEIEDVGGETDARMPDLKGGKKEESSYVLFVARKGGINTTFYKKKHCRCTSIRGGEPSEDRYYAFGRGREGRNSLVLGRGGNLLAFTLLEMGSSGKTPRCSRRRNYRPLRRVARKGSQTSIKIADFLSLLSEKGKSCHQRRGKRGKNDFNSPPILWRAATPLRRRGRKRKVLGLSPDFYPAGPPKRQTRCFLEEKKNGSAPDSSEERDVAHRVGEKSFGFPNANDEKNKRGSWRGEGEEVVLQFTQKGKEITHHEKKKTANGFEIGERRRPPQQFCWDKGETWDYIDRKGEIAVSLGGGEGTNEEGGGKSSEPIGKAPSSDGNRDTTVGREASACRRKRTDFYCKGERGVYLILGKATINAKD